MGKVVLTSLSMKNFALDDLNNALEKAVDRLGFSFGSDVKSVVIKPNLCYYWNYSTGETTDPRLVSAVVDFIRNRGGANAKIFIAEADASAMKTKYAFKALGYEKLSKAKEVPLVNLSEGEIVETRVKVLDKELVLPVNELLLKADLIINMPKLKTHTFAGLTCALKNMFGAIAKPRKYSYHELLPHAIVGINKLVRSDLVVIDGIICRGACPKKLGAIIAGDDSLATDFIAAEIAGLSPKRIKYLVLAEKEKIGSSSNIELIEDNVKLADLRKNFPRYNYSMHKFSWRVQLKLLKAYSKLTGDILPPILSENNA